MTRALPLCLAATGLVAALATPGAAQDTVSLPEGCTAYLTMQGASCSVSHYFTCEDDAAGTQRRVELDLDGVSYFGQIDAETQWLISTYRDTGHTETLEDDPADRASFTELLEEGISTFDFRTLSDELGPLRYVGVDQLTGESVTIDGVDLLATEYIIRVENDAGEVLFTSEGDEFISPEWRTFFGGISRLSGNGGEVVNDSTPIEFLMPGEPGFLTPQPKYGCGATESGWRADP